jgi:PEGA domain/Protein tyrosine and serine/threonine kinase
VVASRLDQGRLMVGNPPQTFGRYYVQGLIADGRTGPVYRAEDPGTRVRVAIKALRTNLPPNVTRQIVDELNRVVDWLPSHPAILSLRAAAVKDLEPHILSEFAPGEPLDQALRRFGPGAIADLLPRLHLIAEGLDLAAKEGIYHGALHPKDVMVSVDSTVITGIGIPAILAKAGLGIPVRPPYTAPEVAKGTAPSSASDQFSLAAIAFEWLFGQAIAGPVRKRMKVPALPDVNGDALASAFTTALAWSPSARFGSCLSFVEAISIAVYGAVEPAVVEPIASAQVEPELVTSTQSEPEPVTSTQLEVEPVASMQVEPEPVTSTRVEPELVATTQAEPEPVTGTQLELEPVASMQVEPEPVTSTRVEPELVATTQAEPEPVTSTQLELEPVASMQVEPEPVTSTRVEPELVATTQAEPEPVTSTQLELEPVASMQVEPEPVTSTRVELELVATPQAEPEPVTGTQLELEPVASMHVEPEVVASADVEPEPPSAHEDYPRQEHWIIAEAGSGADLQPIDIQRPSLLLETPVASASETPIASTVFGLIAPSPLTQTPIDSVPDTPIESATPLVIAPSPLVEAPIAWVPDTPIPSTTPRVIVPSPLAETPVALIPEAPTASTLPGLIAPSPLTETPIDSVPDTPIESATPLVIAPSPLVEAPIAWVPGTPIPSTTPRVIVPSPLAETPVALIPEAPTASTLPGLIAPSALTETPIDSIPDTPIESVTPPAIAPPPTVRRPVAAIAKKPIRSVRLRLVAPTTQEFSNAVIFALSTDGGRGFALALAATLLLGIAVGFGGGYAAARRPLPPASLVARAQAPAGRTAETWMPEPVKPAQNAKTAAAVVSAAAGTVPASKNAAVAADPKRADPKTVDTRKAASETVASRLLVRSTPDGATVRVDGVSKGLTPVELTGLELGSRTVSLSRPGYIAVERRVTLSKSRPARSLDVALVPVAPPNATRQARVAPVPAGPSVPARATVAAPPAPAGNGSLVIESLPSGATVTVNGMARGKTPITIGALPAGNYTLTMKLPNYQPIAMTVHVTAGERARVAPTLTSSDPQRED